MVTLHFHILIGIQGCKCRIVTKDFGNQSEQDAPLGKLPLLVSVMCGVPVFHRAINVPPIGLLDGSLTLLQRQRTESCRDSRDFDDYWSEHHRLILIGFRIADKGLTRDEDDDIPVVCLRPVNWIPSNNKR